MLDGVIVVDITHVICHRRTSWESFPLFRKDSKYVGAAFFVVVNSRIRSNGYIQLEWGNTANVFGSPCMVNYVDLFGKDSVDQKGPEIIKEKSFVF